MLNMVTRVHSFEFPSAPMLDSVSCHSYELDIPPARWLERLYRVGSPHNKPRNCHLPLSLYRQVRVSHSLINSIHYRYRVVLPPEESPLYRLSLFAYHGLSLGLGLALRLSRY